MKAIILAAGLSRRFREVTSEPKCLVTIGGTPLIQRLISCLHINDVIDVNVVTGYKAESIEAQLGRRVNYHYCYLYLTRGLYRNSFSPTTSGSAIICTLERSWYGENLGVSAAVGEDCLLGEEL